MKTWGSGGIAPPFLTLALDGGEWSASCPSLITRRERVHSTHWLWGWLGLNVGLDAVEKVGILHCWESNPGHPPHSLLLYRLNLSWLLVCGDRTFKNGHWPVAVSCSSGTWAVDSLFFHLGRGWLLHNAQSLVFQSLMEIPTASFATSRFRVCLRALCSVFLPPRSSCHFTFHSVMPLMNALPAPLWMLSSYSAGRAQWVNLSSR
jgi:hypothetical protein